MPHSVISPQVGRDDRSETDRRATELITKLAATPHDDPSRPSLRDAAIEAWLPMGERLVRRYAKPGTPQEDLLQSAALGIVKAVDGFDLANGVPFTAYAVPTVLGEIKRYFRDRTWAIRLPRRLQELRQSINQAQAELTHTLRRPPTVADIAAHLNVSQDDVIEGLVGAWACRAVSLSTPLGDGGAELGEFLGAHDGGFEVVELRLALGSAMGCLSDRERRILALRFYGNQTQAQIAAAVGLSQMHVSRVISGALAKLRNRLERNRA